MAIYRALRRSLARADGLSQWNALSYSMLGSSKNQFIMICSSYTTIAVQKIVSGTLRGNDQLLMHRRLPARRKLVAMEIYHNTQQNCRKIVTAVSDHTREQAQTCSSQVNFVVHPFSQFATMSTTNETYLLLMINVSKVQATSYCRWRSHPTSHHLLNTLPEWYDCRSLSVHSSANVVITSKLLRSPSLLLLSLLLPCIYKNNDQNKQTDSQGRGKPVNIVRISSNIIVRISCRHA